MSQPHLPRKFKLKHFRMEIDRKNGAVLTIPLPYRFENHIISKNNVIFSGPFFLKNVSFQIHFTYYRGRASGRVIDHPYG